MKLLAGVIIILAGVALQFKMGLGAAWYLYAGGVLFLIAHFLFGTVTPAFNKLNDGKIEEAEALLAKTKYPQLLSSYHRSYYHLVLGMIDLRKKRMDSAEQHLKKTLEIGKLLRSTDNALAALNIAHINFVQKKYDVAKEYLTKAKSFNSNDLMLKEHVTKMEEALK